MRYRMDLNSKLGPLEGGGEGPKKKTEVSIADAKLQWNKGNREGRGGEEGKRMSLIFFSRRTSVTPLIKSSTTRSPCFSPASLILWRAASASFAASCSAFTLAPECSAWNRRNSFSFCALYASISFAASARASFMRCVR